MFNVSRLTVITHDLVMSAIAIVFAFALRFDSENFSLLFGKLAFYVFPFVAVAGLVYASLSLYSHKWRFASLPDLVTIIKAAAILGAILLVTDYIFTAKNLYGELILGKKTIIIYMILQIVLLGSPRLLYRYYKVAFKHEGEDKAHHILIIGKPNDAELISRANEMQLLKGKIVGLISPQAKDQGGRVRNIKVIGEPSHLENILQEFALRGTPIETAILVPESLPSPEVTTQVLGDLKRHNVSVRRFRFNEMTGDIGQGRFVPMREEELILRSLVPIQEKPVSELIAGKRVIITGGGGSIGTEITLRVASLKASDVLVIEHSEPALYSILERLEFEAKDVRFSGKICDIRDISRLNSIFSAFKPDIVFHAAALKHVPYLEEAPIEAVRTNTLGTMNVAQAALNAHCAAMVLISTDKATRPTSVLGATKRLAEMFMQMMDSQNHATRFVAVRFGNVLGTSGSVVPRFRNQIKEGGPVTVTHKDMVRYFMTVREATDLVLSSAAHAVNDTTKMASIYVLNMGQPVNIYDLAERMIRMAGLTPHEDIEINVTGIRAGERLNEELFAPDEPLVEIGLAGVTASMKSEMAAANLNALLSEMKELANSENETKMHERLLALVPLYKRFIMPK